MRALFSMLGILVVLLIIGLLIKTMLGSGATGAAPAAIANQASGGSITLKVDPQANAAVQSQQLQEQIKSQIEKTQQEAAQRQLDAE